MCIVSLTELTRCFISFYPNILLFVNCYIIPILQFSAWNEVCLFFRSAYVALNDYICWTCIYMPNMPKDKFPPIVLSERVVFSTKHWAHRDEAFNVLRACDKVKILWALSQGIRVSLQAPMCPWVSYLRTT